jgi:phosphatidylinositol glycan class B
VLPSWWTRPLPWRVLLAVGLVTGAAARLWLAFTDHGLYWPDEVFQSIEPAHRMAFGYSMVAWEFVVGARNVLLPGAIALVLEALAALKLDDPFIYVPVVRVLFALSSVGTVWGVYRLSRATGCSLPSAVVGTLAFCWMSLAIYFSPRAMSEVASALPVTWGLALLLETPSRKKLLLGASLLGLAVILRIHCGLFAAGAVVMLLAQRRKGDALVVFGVLCGWAVVYGLLDLFAWGSFLHSGIYYLRFNLIEGRAAEWGTAPPAFYTKYLVKSLGLHWVLIAGLAVLGVRRSPAVMGLALAFLLGHIALPHKELRFIVPFLPLVCAGAAAGVEQLLSWRRWQLGVVSAVALLLTSAWSFATFHTLTFQQIGGWDSVSAYDSGGPVTRLMMVAGRRPDLCGLGLTLGSRGATFAYFALHRDVPFYEAPLPDEASRFYNYVIAEEGTRTGEVVAVDHGAVLLRLNPGPCEHDASFTPWLDERTRTLAASPESRFRP